MNHLNAQQLRYLQELLDVQETSTRIRARLHILEQADDCDVADVSDARTLMELHELSDIEAARQRMAEEQYGICVDCGCPIDYARLEANVTAKRCLECQNVYEEGDVA